MLITNIQKMCFHDGPGIRTTVFLKGCSARCPWCANPENMENRIEFDKYGEQIGYNISNEDLQKEILKDRNFYKNGGGVTFSGGEPLLQIYELEDSLIKLKKEKINICFETALFVPKKNLKIATKYTDIFIIDIKILDGEICNEVIKTNIENYFDNLEIIMKQNVKTIFRIPLIKPYIYNEKNIELVVRLLKKYNVNEVQLLEAHKIASEKYKNIGKKMVNYDKLEKEELQMLIKKFNDEGINCIIYKI